MKKHNFYAGPSILPEYTIENTAAAIKDFAGTGLSILEISHRSKPFVAVMDEAVALFKELLNIPEGYSVIFVGGGASTQFAMIPFNIFKKKSSLFEYRCMVEKSHKRSTGIWGSRCCGIL